MVYFFRFIVAIIFLYSVSSLDVYAFSENYSRLQKLENQNKLPSKRVRDIIQDSNGYIWFATEYGLARYDGKKFKVYNANEEDNYIVHNLVKKVLGNGSGDVFVATDSGVSIIKRDSNDIHFGYLGDIVDIYYDIAKETLYVTDGFSLYHINDDKVIKVEKYESINILKVFVWDNEIVFLTQNGIYSKDKNSYLLSFESELGIFDYTIFENNLYLISDYYMYKSDLKSVSKVLESPEESLFRSIGIYDEESLYVSTYSDEFVLYKNTNDFRIYEDFGNSIDKVFFDDSGVQWFVGSNGVSYISSLKNYSDFYPLNRPKNYIKKDDGLYIKTKEGYFDINGNLLETNSEYLWQTAEDEFGTWFLYEKRLTYKYNNSGKVLNFYKNDGSLPNSDLYRLEVNDNDSVWISGYSDAGIFLFKKTGEIIKSYNEGFVFSENDNYISAVLKKGDFLYLGTTNGLSIINILNDEFEHFYINDQSSNVRINDFDFDEKGVLWIATEGFGLYTFQNNSLSKVLSNYPTYRFLNVYEKDNVLFLSSEDEFFEYDIALNQFFVYKTLLDDFNLSFYQDRISLIDKHIFIPSRNGIVKIDVDSLSKNLYNSKIVIDYVEIDGESVDGENIFNYGTDISFKFDSLDFNSSNKVFKYKLNGIDDKWIHTDINKATYNNLPYGDYEFIVNGTNSDDVWSNASAVYKFKIKKPWWFYALFVISCTTLLVVVFYLISRQKQLKNLYYRANYDQMTGLANRFKFKKLLNELYKDKNNLKKTAMVFLSINEFKIINDSLGYHIGDELIKKLALKITNFFEERGFVARFGGDEFSILIYDYNNIDYLKNILNGLSDVASAEYNIEGNSIRLSCSVGASIYEDNIDFDLMIRNADIAMCKSKKGEFNKCVIFESNMQDQFVEKAEIKNDLHKVIENNELKLLFQPKVSPISNAIVGFESLVRWIHPEKGLIRPDYFIEEAERNGTIIPIGRWVISKTIEMASDLHYKGLLIDNISFNFSPMQIYDDGLFLFIKNEIERFNLPPEKLEMEITESLFLSDFEKTLELLNKLRSLGVSIGLDDFGTGYSSLNYLLKIPIDTLKLDRAFVQEIHISKNKNLVKHIFNMASDFNFKVVVEGIENEKQLEILTELGFFSYQGYFYSPPVDEKTVSSMF